MISWTTVATVFLSAGTIGLLCDRLILHRQKQAIHERLIGAWLALDRTKLPRLHTIMAEWALAPIEWAMRKGPFSARTLASALMATFILTTGFALVGHLTGVTVDPLRPSTFGLPYPTFYLVNAPFDFLAMIITYHVLCLLRKHRLGVFCLAVLVDLLAAVSLLLICSALSGWLAVRALDAQAIGMGSSTRLMRELLNPDWDPNDTWPPRDQIYTEVNSVHLHLSDAMRQSPEWTLSLIRRQPVVINAFFTLTTESADRTESQTRTGYGSALIVPLIPLLAMSALLPTAMYLLVLLIMVLLRSVVASCRASGLHLLEAITERNSNEFSPGLLIGISLGILTTLIKLLLDLS